MNEIKVFNNAEFGKIRTLNRDGEPWFVGKDVATAERNPHCGRSGRTLGGRKSFANSARSDRMRR